MADFDGLTDQFMNSLPSGASLPRLKAPIDLSNLAGCRRAVFEIDTDDVSRLLDDEEDANFHNDEAPVTETNPRLYAAGSKKKPYVLDPKSDLSFSTFYDPEFISQMEDVVDGDGAVKKSIVKEGSGTQVPADACKVYVHYIICGENNEEPFDSTVERGYPICLDYRNCGTIAGLYLAVRSMHVHEVAKVWIRFDYAYGALGCPPRIAPASNVFCIIEVLDVVEESQLKLIPFMPSDERQQLDFPAIYDAAKASRAKGNSDYTQGAFWTAIKEYRKALEILEEYATINEEDQNKRQDLVFTLYQNLAICYLKVNRPHQTCICCHMGLRSKQREDSTFAKLYFRFAEAKFLLGQIEEAMKLNKEALRREPKDKAILAQKEKLMQRKKQEYEITKSTFTKMGGIFGKNSTEVGPPK